MTISEDELGFIRPNGDALDDIVSVFAHSGALLAEVDTRQRQTGLGVRVERMLRYYLGERGDRRVDVLDGRGSHWPGRLVGTRWHPKGRVWFVLRNAEAAAA